MNDDSWWDSLKRRFEETSDWATKTGDVLYQAENLGDLMVRLNQRLQSAWNGAFNGKNIIIFGPREAGKTSLIGYLRTGRANVEEYNPTSGWAIVDRRFEIENSEWLKVQKDVGGDKHSRSLWPELTKMVDPNAVIFVLDGRKTIEQTENDMKECLEDSLSQYGNDNKQLKLIYIFVNFYDSWGSDEDKDNDLIAGVLYIAGKQRKTYPALSRIKIKAEPTHINPDATKWPELELALKKLADDLQALD